MSKVIRVGLIGAGAIAKAHISGYRSVDDVELVAVWNRTKTRAEQLVRDQELHGAKVYDDWRSLLSDAQLDVLSVVTAPQLRAEPVLMALTNGIHTLVEKPFATSLEDAGKMVACAKESVCVTAVCFTWRYKASVLAARRIIQSGKIGQVRNCSSVWRFSCPPGLLCPDARPFMNEAQGGLGMLGENGSHQFDMISFLTGEVVDELIGKMEWIEPQDPDLRANFAHHLVGNSKNDVGVTIEHTMPPGPFWVASQRLVYVEGSKGHVRIDGGLVDDGSPWIFVEGDSEAKPIDLDAAESSVAPQHAGLIQDFISTIRLTGKNRKRPERLPTFADGLQSLKSVMAGLKADREKRWVSVSDLDDRY
jgi:predicted dehydrogenase